MFLKMALNLSMITGDFRGVRGYFICKDVHLWYNNLHILKWIRIEIKRGLSRNEEFYENKQDLSL